VRWKEENEYVLDDIRYRVSQEPFGLVQAVALHHIRHVCFLHWGALEDCDQDCHQPQDANRSAKDIHARPHGSGRKDADVHSEDGRFYRKKEGDVEIFGNVEVLTAISFHDEVSPQDERASTYEQGVRQSTRVFDHIHHQRFPNTAFVNT
jgi:hypothetical protein